MHTTTTKHESHQPTAEKSQQNGKKSALSQTHLQLLAARGISEQTAQAAGLFSADAAGVRQCVGHNPSNSSGLIIPYKNPASLDHADLFYRARLDTPMKAGSGSLRYLHPKGLRNHLYFPPGASGWLSGDAPIMIAEGELKSLALSQHGIQAISVPGVWGWKSKQEPSGVIPCMDLVSWQDRSVTLAFDNDISEKEQVRKALEALAAELYGRGAQTVLELEIPHTEGVKLGVDDYLASFGFDAFQALPRHKIENPSRPPLHALNLGEFLGLNIKPREQVLSPILPTQGLVMLHAQRGIGKTFVSLGIAYAVASGGKFLRWAAEKPRRVLFVDGEMPAVAIQERLSKLALSDEAKPPSPDHLKIITPDLQDLGIPNLTTPEGQALIEQHLDGVELLVLDNLSTLASYGEENAAESWQPIQEWALKLRRQGLSVLFIHHSGKTGMQRGTSRREDVLDTVINLRRPSDYQPEQGARFEVHLEKARGIAGDQVSPFEAELVEDENALQTWTVKDLKTVELERVVALHNEGLTQRDIAQELGLSKSTVNRLLIRVKIEQKI